MRLRQSDIWARLVRDGNAFVRRWDNHQWNTIRAALKERGCSQRDMTVKQAAEVLDRYDRGFLEGLPLRPLKEIISRFKIMTGEELRDETLRTLRTHNKEINRWCINDCILKLLDKDERTVRKARAEQHPIGSLKDLGKMKDVVKSLTGSYNPGLDSSTNSEVFIRKYDTWVEATKDYKLRLQLQARMKFLFGQWKVGIAR
jgi:hypothetical protein